MDVTSGTAPPPEGRDHHMDVLLLDSDGEDTTATEAELTSEGHRVFRCHEQGLPAFPCNGLHPSSSCPLDEHPMDVAVVVRQHPWPRPTLLEDCVSCALRHHVPLVVTGATALNPYDGYATRVVDGPDDLAGACEEAARAPLPRHSSVATDMLRSTLARLGADSDARCEVVRSGDGSLTARLFVAGVDRKVAGQAATRVLGALRAVDHSADRINVTLVDTGEKEVAR
jgi:hypothetical protein